LSLFARARATGYSADMSDKFLGSKKSFSSSNTRVLELKLELETGFYAASSSLA
jgi:hypothetical protein